MITADSNLGRLLDEHPGLVEFLAGYHEHFARLRSRVLRRVMAPRVTVAQAARVAGVPAADLVAALRGAIGAETAPDDTASGDDELPARPPALDRLAVVELDVRDDIRRGAEPLKRIVAAAKALAPGATLAIRAPFEPVPLYGVLGERGLAHWTERLADADWRIWFYRCDAEVPATPGAAAATGARESARAGDGDPAVLDVRGLEPPLPMVRVLERLDTLPPGGVLRVLHERRPMFLYPQLDHRGFMHGTVELGPGLVQIVIRRPDD
jgi:uncharacterized protein (DUF2249 family)